MYVIWKIGQKRLYEVLNRLNRIYAMVVVQHQGHIVAE